MSFFVSLYAFGPADGAKPLISMKGSTAVVAKLRLRRRRSGGGAGRRLLSSGYRNRHFFPYRRAVDRIFFMVPQGLVAVGTINKSVGIPRPKPQLIVLINNRCLAFFTNLPISQSAMPLCSLISHKHTPFFLIIQYIGNKCKKKPCSCEQGFHT